MIIRNELYSILKYVSALKIKKGVGNGNTTAGHGSRAAILYMVASLKKLHLCKVLKEGMSHVDFRGKSAKAQW